MAANCIDCAEPLPLKRRLLGKDRCELCQTNFEREEAERRAEEQAAFEEAEAEYREVVAQLQPGLDLNVMGARVREAMQITRLAPAEVQRLNSEAISLYIERAQADDVISPGEDRFLAAALRALSTKPTLDQWADYSVSAIESGLMFRDPEPQIQLKQDEIAHWHSQVEFLKRNVHKEARWTSHGVSLPVGDTGIRYRISQGRGRMVTTGTTIDVDDRGVLSITSQRIVFTGGHQTKSWGLHRLLGVQLMADGVGLQIENLQSLPMFKTGLHVNEVIGALAIAAAQNANGTRQLRRLPTTGARPAPPLPRLLERHGYRDPDSPPQDERLF
jgi:hypothetical protein